MRIKMVTDNGLAHALTVALLGGWLCTCSTQAAEVSFKRDIEPLLIEHCHQCHGPEKQKGGLRLDNAEAALRGGDDGKAVVPGDAAKSKLLAMVRGDDPDAVMPPKGKRLTAEQIALLTKWIAAGADWPSEGGKPAAVKLDHWSFQKLKQPALPAVQNAAWAANAIDRFILARLEKAKLTPSPKADRYTLIRRLSLDLIGLPATPEEADAFAKDSSADGYERVVDRLLASPRYGEHWASVWLDLARYADTKGYERDNPRTMWSYRDWVIDAYNADMPYDRFTIAQLAGDLLPDSTDAQKLATAFHRSTPSNDEGGTDDEEFRVVAVKDRVDTTMQVWMGLTMGCAQCHTHKYDPITLREYYSFYAILNQTEDADRGDDAPTAAFPSTHQRTQIDELTAKINALRETLAKEKSAAPKLNGEIAALDKQLANIRKQAPNVPIMRELPENKHRVTRVHTRGNFLDPGDTVKPGVPAAFGLLNESEPANRLAVARWLMHQDNPLTARVAVNRIWARLFGIGIVETEEDFGTQGTGPSHPELLDWLAAEYQGSLGWSQKKLLKAVVMSATYQQSSVAEAKRVAADPQNRLLSRGARFRLTGETVRDQALAISGLLSAKLHGPPVMPQQPDGIWRTIYSGMKWQTSAGEDAHRRALYTFLRRTSPYPSMLTFDAGSREVCLIRRVRTNTPLQALVTLNDPVYIEAAGALAKRMLTEAGPGASDRAARGLRLVVLRKPDAVETDRLVKLFDEVRGDYRNDAEGAAALAAQIPGGVPKGVATDEAAAWVAVANVLLNLDEAVMHH